MVKWFTCIICLDALYTSLLYVLIILYVCIYYMYYISNSVNPEFHFSCSMCVLICKIGLLFTYNKSWQFQCSGLCVLTIACGHVTTFPRLPPLSPASEQFCHPTKSPPPIVVWPGLKPLVWFCPCSFAFSVLWYNVDSPGLHVLCQIYT